MGDIISKDRIAYYDTLRFVAILSIVAVHVFMIWRNGAQVFGFDIFAFSETVGFGVSMFLMLSGALLLNREIELSFFIRRRLSRIFYPFVFYVILLFVTGFALSNPVSYNIFSHYWYFWLIIGVYLSLPIINKFIQHASIREIEYFLAVFAVGSVFYQAVLIFNFEQYFDLNFFVAPLGFLVLGYYLSVKDFQLEPKKMVCLTALVFVGVTVVRILALGGVIPYDFVFDFNATQSKILGSWLDVSIFRIVHVASLFLFFRYLYELDKSRLKGFLETDIVKGAILSASRASYGIYLVELIFRRALTPFFVGIPHSGTGICLTIVLMTAVIFGLSWATVIVFSRIPGLKRFSGYY